MISGMEIMTREALYELVWSEPVMDLAKRLGISSAGAFLHFAFYQAKGSVRTTGTQVGFVVDDVTTAHAKAMAAGAMLIHEPRPEPWGPTSRYHDFDGNVVSLTQQPGSE